MRLRKLSDLLLQSQMRWQRLLDLLCMLCLGSGVVCRSEVHLLQWQCTSRRLLRACVLLNRRAPW